MNEVRPDAILSIERRKIAIELELSGKGIKQYEMRFSFYEKHPAIDAVIYFIANPKLREKLLGLSKPYTKIYVVLLANFTTYQQNTYVECARFEGAIRLIRFLKMIKERRNPFAYFVQ